MLMVSMSNTGCIPPAKGMTISDFVEVKFLFMSGSLGFSKARAMDSWVSTYIVAMLHADIRSIDP